MDTKLEIAEIVADLMETGETKQAFAIRVGIKRDTVYKWLQGQRATLKLASVVKLAAVASDEQVRRLYAAVGLRLPACESCGWIHPRPLEALVDEEARNSC